MAADKRMLLGWTAKRKTKDAIGKSANRQISKSAIKTAGDTR
jgi:hypothetical protein